MGKHLTEFEKGQIWAFRHLKRPMSFRKIAKKLKKPKSTVSDCYTSMKERGTYKRKRGSGRPTSLTKNQKKRIVVSQKRDPFLSAKNLKTELKLSCSTQTVQNVLKNAGLKSYFSKFKPFISEKNRKRRLAWALKHRNWTKFQWRRVLFSDESPFTVRFQLRVRVRRPFGLGYHPRYLRGTVKHDKKINVWGCFSWKGVGTLYRVKGILEQNQMKNILQRCMVPSMKRLVGLYNGVFQQDNDPKHRSKKCQNYLKNKDIKLLPWPSQSPDLNPIENLWVRLNKDCKNRKCKNEDELFEVLKQAWENLDSKYLQALVDSMPKRCEVVIRNHEWPTKY